MQVIEQTICDFISQEILHESGEGSIDPERLLLEEGILDSMGLQQLIVFLESEFDLIIGDDLLDPENFNSVRTIAGVVSLKLEG